MMNSLRKKKINFFKRIMKMLFFYQKYKNGEMVQSFQSLCDKVESLKFWGAKTFLQTQLKIRVVGLGWKQWKYCGKGVRNLQQTVQAMMQHFEACFGNTSHTSLLIPSEPVLQTNPLPCMLEERTTQRYTQQKKKLAAKVECSFG